MPAAPSSSPGGNTRKKFGRKLSQRILRMLATSHGQRFARHVEAELVAQLQLQGLLVFGRYGHQRLAGVGRRPPATRRSIDCPPSVAADQVRFCSRSRNPRPASPVQFKRLGGLCIDGGDARTHHGIHLRLTRGRAIAGSPASDWRSSGRILIRKLLGTSFGRLRRQSASRSPRTTASSSSTINPKPKATICTTLPPPRRETLARP